MSAVIVSLPAQALPLKGDFVYHRGVGSDPVYYRVHPIDYQGIPAQEVVWENRAMRARHVLRRSDGKPLYTLRENLQRHDSIEVIYARRQGEPTLYRQHSHTGVVERKIRAEGLRDLGSLPVILGAALLHQDEIRFSALNYADGSVYAFRAAVTGYRQMTTASGLVRCALIEVRLDSWMAALLPRVQLVVPLLQAGMPFITYSGPALAGAGGTMSLHLSGITADLAMLKTR